MKYPEGTTEDLVFLIKILLTKKPDKISFVKKSLYNYCIRDDIDMASRFYHERVFESATNLANIKKLLQHHGVYTKFKNYYSVCSAMWFMHAATCSFYCTKDAYPFLLHIRQILKNHQIPMPDFVLIFYLRNNYSGMVKFTISKILLHCPITCKVLQPVAKFYRRIKFGFTS